MDAPVGRESQSVAVQLTFMLGNVAYGLSLYKREVTSLRNLTTELKRQNTFAVRAQGKLSIFEFRSPASLGDECSFFYRQTAELIHT